MRAVQRMRTLLVFAATALPILPTMVCAQLPVLDSLLDAKSYYQRLHADSSVCTQSVTARAKNERAILDAAMPRYVSSIGQYGSHRFVAFAESAMGLEASDDICLESLVWLEPRVKAAVGQKLARDLKLEEPVLPSRQVPASCSADSFDARTQFTQYLQANVAFVMWQEVAEQCGRRLGAD